MGNNKKKKVTQTAVVNGNSYRQSGPGLQDTSHSLSQESLSDKSSVRQVRSAATSPTFALPINAQSCAPRRTVETQTRATCVDDGLIALLAMNEWDRFETMCEMFSHLPPYEILALRACIEGAVRACAHHPAIRTMEGRANSNDFFINITPSIMSYPDWVGCAFALVSTLKPTNHSQAFSLIKLIDKLLQDRHFQLKQLTYEIALNVLSDLGKLVAAAIHHPAFSTDQKHRLMIARDELRRERYKMSPKKPVTCSSSVSSGSQPFYVKYFRGSQHDSMKPDEFLIEMIWSDGLRTWVQRTRDDILSFHLRLLDVFGVERREEFLNDDPSIYPSSSSSSSSPFERTNSPAATQASLTTNPSRILPYLSHDHSPAQIIEYINSLSDLPARMMLSSVIYQEFYVSRANLESAPAASTTPLLQQSWSPPACLRNPITTAPTFPVVMHPLLYGNLAESSTLQMIRPSCSNCAGNHPFVYCKRRNTAENGKYDYELARLRNSTGGSEETHSRPTPSSNVNRSTPN